MILRDRPELLFSSRALVFQDLSSVDTVRTAPLGAANQNVMISPPSPRSLETNAAAAGENSERTSQWGKGEGRKTSK